MSDRHEASSEPRFTIENAGTCEQIVIPAERSIFAMLFLTAWLGGWTFGGVSVFSSGVAKGFQPFTLFWLCGWLLGEVGVLVTLAWMAFGKEIVRLCPGGVDVIHTALGLSRRKRYRSDVISGVSSRGDQTSARRNRTSLPFLGRESERTGTIVFTYGSRSVYLGSGLDEAEARIVAGRIRAHVSPAAP